MAADALQALTEQVFTNMKQGSPALDDLVKAAAKYHSAMEAANQAAAAFIDAMGKVAVSASRARGATSELGQTTQKVVARHHAVLKDRYDQTKRFNDQFIQPLQKRIKADSRTMPKMESDFQSMSKSFKNDLKKASQGTIKAQKQAKKGKADSLDAALESLDNKSKEYESFNQRCLRSVLIEERRRYAYLIDSYISVFNMDLMGGDADQTIIDTLSLAEDPEELPASSQALIEQNSSNGLLLDYDPMAQSLRAISPSPLTQEVQERHRRATSPHLPPGCPPGGLAPPVNEPSSPRQRRTTQGSFRPGVGPAGGVPIDVVIAQRKASLMHRPSHTE